MRKLKHALLLVFLMLPFLSIGQTDKIPVDSKIKTGQLPNGLKYFIIQNKKPEKKIELRLAVNAGSILEDKDQLGLAHFLEHMNFNGSKHFPKNEVVHYLQSIGVEFGADLNAYTSFDETVYILPIPADDKKKIDQGFQILADWAGNALLENEEIDKERNIILEESRLGKGAGDRMMKKWLPEYLNGSLYANRLPIGDETLLKTFKYDVLKRFYKDWYRPNLQAVMVVGDIDPAEAERQIKEKFSSLKNPENARPRPHSFEVPARTASKAMVVSDKEQPYTMIQIIGNTTKEIPSTTAAEYLDDVEQNLFNAMLSARLDELKSAANPPFIFGFGGFGGGFARYTQNFQLAAICGNDKIETAIDAIVKEAMKIKKYGFTSAELERAKASMLAGYEKMYNERDKTESKQRVDELVRHFLTNECIPGIEWEYNFVKENLARITVEEVNKQKDKIDIDKNYFALVTTQTSDKLPSDAQVKAYVDKSLQAEVVAYQEKELPKQLLSQQPKAGNVVKETKDATINSTTWTLSNGAKVTYKKTDFKNDEIIFSGYRFGGASTYTATDYQSADYCNNVVDEMGYGAFSSTDLQKFLQGKTLGVNTWVDMNGDYVSGSSTVKDFETALQLLYLKSTSTRKDAEAFESFKNRQIQMIAQMKSSPESYYGDTLSSFMYNHNPRMKEIPTPADYNAINMDHAVAFYNQRFNTANGMNYFFVGSIPEATFKKLIELYIGGLGGNAIESKTKDLGIEPLKGTHDFTVYAGTEPKSMVNEIAYFYTPYNQNDELALSLLTEVVNNRITDIIREKMSAIYGGGAGLRLSKFPKEKFTLQSYLPCGPENAAKVKVAFWEILNEVKKPGNVLPEELSKAAETSIQKYKVGVKTNNFWLSSLSKYTQYGLPTANILNLESRIRAIQPATLTAVANKYIVEQNVIHALLMPEKK